MNYYIILIEVLAVIITCIIWGGPLILIVWIINNRKTGKGKQITSESPYTDFDYSRYHYRKLIEAIRGLAMDYKVQITLIPQQILWATARELVDDYDIEFRCRNQMRRFNLISDVELEEFEELDNLIEIIVRAKLFDLEDLEKRQEWEHVRQYSRQLLNKMELEIKPPVVITWEDVLP